jgi:hypothetical protein
MAAFCFLGCWWNPSVQQNHSLDCTTCPRELTIHVLRPPICVLRFCCHSQCTLNRQAAYACTSNNVSGSGMTNLPYLAWCTPRRAWWICNDHIRCRGLRAGWLAARGRGRQENHAARPVKRCQRLSRSQGQGVVLSLVWACCQQGLKPLSRV